MKTKAFILNGITVIINIEENKTRHTYVTYFFSNGEQVNDYSKINEDTKKLIEACIEVIVKEEGAILWSY